MRSIRRFIHAHVEPADRLGEMIFGLIMALGVTGAIRFGADGIDNRELFVSVLGCNIAWGIVDGVVLVLMRLFERGRFARVVREARKAPDDDAAFAIVEREMAEELVRILTPDERGRVRSMALSLLKRAQTRPPAMQRGDLLHGVAAGLAVLLPTLPVVVPFLLFDEPLVATRVSNLIALLLLFVIGVRWGHLVGGNSLRIGGALTLVGVVLVAITIALGG